jgi:hemerythrin-like domain-containing protein
VFKDIAMGLSRRDLLVGIGGVSGGMILAGRALAVVEPEPSKEVMGGEVTATEDLMREHGILRRALFIYSEAAVRLRNNPSTVSPDALQKTAKLFRTFGEDYHEKKLEEAFVFPAVKKAGGATGSYTDILIEQHNRGRDLTDYILDLTRTAKFEAENGAALAKALDLIVRMYRPHAAKEDTVIFPAWKQTLTAKQLDDMNDKFEDIEHDMLGKNGFENAVKQISDIENELGFADLAQFTAPIIRK